ncbi:hypothetical protein CKO15_10500 [Halorhodospira abdelmalekii]|uniref:hypothetical protein n=1 Tax=Halorhodospira abdelmalekii TaxID=421629 RepID=UPI001908A6A3|nr:hypothetical protein [Halorhodospira abdelmalekii]MBK1735704.1 hypothetical protein [Halorhodospira abdelmalekii]
MHLKTAQTGATFIELIVAIVVIGVVTVGFSAALINSFQLMAQHSYDPEEWLHEARSCAERIIKEYGAGIDGEVFDCNTDAGENSETIASSVSAHCKPESLKLAVTISNDNDYCKIAISDNSESIVPIILHIPISSPN